MAEAFVGEIRINAFGFAPEGWAECNGQKMLVAQNQALNALIYNIYGKSDSVNFYLPDLRGRTPIAWGVGQMPGESTRYDLGSHGGVETVPLTTAQIPLHTHQWSVTDIVGDALKPAAHLYATPKTGALMYAVPTTATTDKVVISPKTIAAAGVGAGHPNMQPFLVLNFCIALTGYFPPRD